MSTACWSRDAPAVVPCVVPYVRGLDVRGLDVRPMTFAARRPADEEAAAAAALTMRCSDYIFISSMRASASGPIRGNGAVQRDGLFYDRRVGLNHVGGRS